MRDDSSLIPVILGPTASGKTSVGIELASLLGGEVISVDSRKVYEGLPIGTATPEGTWVNSVFIVKNIPHHLMCFLKPDKPYDAGDFCQHAERLIGEIRARGKVPILVGGTGFYFKALAQGLPPLPKADDAFRDALERRIDEEGVDAVREELLRIDPEAVAAITKGDRHKIIRALEVFHLTGRRFSAWKNERAGAAPRHRFTVMGLLSPKDYLDKRIEQRSARMFELGMIEEAENVLKQGYASDCHALASFGYREAVEVIQGKRPRGEFLPSLIKGTKAYAKRQRTWFRTQVKPFWFPFDASSESPSGIRDIAMKMKAFCYTERE